MLVELQRLLGGDLQEGERLLLRALLVTCGARPMPPLSPVAGEDVQRSGTLLSSTLISGQVRLGCSRIPFRSPISDYASTDVDRLIRCLA